MDRRFGIRFEGYSEPTFPLDGGDTNVRAPIGGSFELEGCKGVPELGNILDNFLDNFKHAIRPEWESTGYETSLLKWVEFEEEKRHDKPQNDFTLENYFFKQPDHLRFTQVLIQTPWIFKMTTPWHLSYLDKLWLNGRLALPPVVGRAPAPIIVGTWLPFFYNDKKRTFFVLPSLKHASIAGGVRSYYPEIKQVFRQWEDFFEGQVQSWVNSLDLSTLTPTQRQQLEQFLSKAFPEEPPPQYTVEQVKELLKRWVMRFIHYFLGVLSLYLFQFREFHFKNYYHPFVCDFAKLVYNPLKGIPALMSRETQLKDTGFSFNQAYQPQLPVVEPTTEDFYPKELVDFTPDGAYSPYNWEIFFHAPLLIANSLSKNQRFEEARDWYHFIFNPIGLESPMPGGPPISKYWITKPFFETMDPKYVQQRIDNILRMLAGDTSLPDYSAQAKKDLEDQVFDWRTNPFEPHRIANYRTVAYQKTVVMKYLDNLIAWGDYLFRQDSMESINEATQLYILAAEILGPRPKRIPPQAKPPMESFNELEKEFDKFSNALVEVENLVPVLPGNGPEGADPAPLPMLYFCIPQNDKMLGYWDTVADRLFKIRYCMNIEGVVRQLALFEPPIDPGALVKAVAGGVDISSALADLNAPLPLYRFNVLLQKANEVCNDVKALGSALLAALEKRDAEALGLLRQSQEIRLLEAVKAVRDQQIEEARENLAGVKKSKELAQIRKHYYESREFMNAKENLAHNLSIASTDIDAAIALAYVLSGGLKALPQFLIGASGFGGSPHATAGTGGMTFGSIAEDTALTLSSISRALEKGASIASTIGSYQRRQQEWDFQEDLAIKEIEQIDKQIAAAELRIAMAEKELENHIVQVENAKATDAFMRSKYTNEDLYQWQVGQISGVYFQSYKLAYDLAKRAERCFRFELGVQDSNYIQFGYWDSLKKGLLAGDKLHYDLKRMEMAYLDQNKREYEITKHIALAMLDPIALVQLKETGACVVNLPEAIFDLDYPGHYMRRIKSVSLTIPCVTGPYTSVNCTLTLHSNTIRISNNPSPQYARNTDGDDPRFKDTFGAVQSIATSNAQNDSGLFELNFRDERYLPFEGAGVISRWRLELPTNFRQFDYDTISDVIFHINYTAREGGSKLKEAAVTTLQESINNMIFGESGERAGLFRIFSAKHEFPGDWHRFLYPASDDAPQVLPLGLTQDRYPFLFRDKTVEIPKVELLLKLTDGFDNADGAGIKFDLTHPQGMISLELNPLAAFGGLLHAEQTLTPPSSPGSWVLEVTDIPDALKSGDTDHLNPEAIEDIGLICHYVVTE